MAGRVVPPLAAVALTTTLAAALQVRQLRVSGTHRFPASDIESALRPALGGPAIAARASTLRATVRAIPWVADASVRISLDGVVSCTVVERVPVAVALDAGVRRLVDGEGRLLAPAQANSSLLVIDGFAPYTEERGAVLAAVPALERAWGGKLERADRVGPHDVALHFAGTAPVILADPDLPGALAEARRVLAAWTARHPAPLRLDARIAGRVAVLPAPPAPEEG
ncbi:MAG TPA: FtsQ-type POTRA domain-containing protein [Thermoanaerobaculaceae bacterium]|nr:FtsQ-type POTRA domain-containing protein [Thermoanaerobaculaceae bacterium]